MAALEAEETSEEAAAEAHADRVRQAERSRSELTALEVAARKAERAVDELEAEMARVLAALPPDVSRHVARLQRRYPRAVVRVVDGACGGCFGQLPPQSGVDAEQGRIAVRCPSCARYIVHPPWRKA